MGNRMAGSGIRMTDSTADITPRPAGGNCRHNYRISTAMADITVIKTVGGMLNYDCRGVTAATVTVGQNRVVVNCSMFDNSMTGVTINIGAGRTGPLRNCCNHLRIAAVMTNRAG